MPNNIKLTKIAVGNGTQTFANEEDFNNVLTHSVTTAKRILPGAIPVTEVRQTLRIAYAYPALTCGDSTCPPKIDGVAKLTFSALEGADISDIVREIKYSLDNLMVKSSKLDKFVRSRDEIVVGN